jgi:hypothetical protein
VKGCANPFFIELVHIILSKNGWGAMVALKPYYYFQAAQNTLRLIRFRNVAAGLSI